MQTAPISFGNQNNDKTVGGLNSAMKSAGNAALNVGVTAGIGIAAGGTAGKIASFVPVKPNEKAIMGQYADIFKKAVASEQTPAHIINAGNDIVDITKNAKKALEDINYYGEQNEITAVIKDVVKKSDDAYLAGNEFNEAFNKAFGSQPGVKRTKDELLKWLEQYENKIKDKPQKLIEQFEKCKNDFSQKLKNLKNTDIDKMAEEGAKHLRKRTVIGVGMAIGLLAAFTFNLLKINGVFAKKPTDAQTAEQAPASPTGQIPGMQPQAPIAQPAAIQTPAAPAQAL